MSDSQNGGRVYSDGAPNELAFLRIAQEFPEDALQDFVEARNNYLLEHTFSAIRQNILSWYPFRADADMLEIGAGMGAVTGLLCDRCRAVTALEMSERRAEVLRARHGARQNLSVVTGPFQSWQTEQKFDYVVCIGVLEYAELFSDAPAPFLDFLAMAKSRLKPGGVMLLAIENRFGLKYWCGAGEDHLWAPFIGIQGYPSGKSAKTFSRRELEEMLQRAGLPQQRFYYPLPDYKFPQVIASDEHLPCHTDLEDLRFTYHRSSLLVASEKELYREILRNGVFGFFADSFFVEAGAAQLPENPVVYASAYGRLRRQFRILTTVDHAGRVKKIPAGKEAAAQLRAIHENTRYLLDRGVPMAEEHLRDDVLLRETPRGVRADLAFGEALANNDRDAVCCLIGQLKSALEASSDIAAPGQNTIVQNGLGDGGHDYGIVLKKGFVDMLLQNCNYEQGKSLVFYDQEMCFPDVPLQYILYRAVTDAYEKARVRSAISYESLLEFIAVPPAVRQAYDRFTEQIRSVRYYRVDDPEETRGDFLPYSPKMTLQHTSDRMNALVQAFGGLKEENERLGRENRELKQTVWTLEDRISAAERE